MRKYVLISIAFIVPLIVWGCMQTGTVVLVHDMQGFESTNAQLGYSHVDLTNEAQYNEIKDKIKSIDAVAVAGLIANKSDSSIAGEIWISDNQYTTPSEVKANAVKVFESPTIAAHDTLNISWNNGLSMIQNLPDLKSHVLSGTPFYAYGIVHGPVDIWYKLSLVVTVTAGL